MGKCLSKTSVIVEDAYRSVSESASEIQRKYSARNYTQVRQSDNTTILSNYEDETDSQGKLSVGEQEIEDIFNSNIDTEI